MQISQFKTETDFATAAPPPEGYYLRWVKQNADGTVTEYIKDHTGAVQVLTGGGGGTSSGGSGIRVVIAGQEAAYYADLDTLIPVLLALDSETTEGVLIEFEPKTYSTSLNADFVETGIPFVIHGNGAILNFEGTFGLYIGSQVYNCEIFTTGVFTSARCYYDYVDITAAAGFVSIGKVRMSFCRITGDVVVNSAKGFDASRCEINGTITANGEMCRLMDCIITANSASPALNSTAGYLVAFGVVIVNSGGGGDIRCDNGTANPPNMINNTYCYSGGISCGNSPTLIGTVYTATEISGTGAARLPAADESPTENSDNLITSGGVYAALGNIENALDAIINGGA